MRRTAPLALFLLISVGLSLTAAQAPGGRAGGPQGAGGRGAPARVAQPTGMAAIRGRIVTADTGAPIRRAQVRATANEGRGTRLVSTDADGRFELRDLPAGRWQVTASKAGFVTLRFGQNRPFEAGRPIDLKDGDVMQGLQMALPRGSAITGRVFDEFGDPVAGARLAVMRYQLVQGARRLTPTGNTDQSDDTGAFRLFGLMPGDYYVSAFLPTLQADDPGGASAGYAPTYYPGTSNVNDARRITLSLGQEFSGASFALLPVRTVRVSGTVIDSMARPLANAVVMLSTPDGSSVNLSGGRGNVRGDGTFTLSNVAPGAYTLTVTSGPGRRGGGAGEVAQIGVTVGNDDITGLYVATTKGATLTGSIAAAPGSAGTLSTSGLQITASAAASEPAAVTRPTRVESDGTFALSGLFGQRMIRVAGVPSTWMVHSMTLNGTDVTDVPVAFRANEQVAGLRVLMTDRITELMGKVSTASGALQRDYTVVIFPEDEAKWTSGSRFLRTARPDQDGLFKIRALPTSSRYLAVAVDYLEDGEGADSTFLEQIRPSATRFALGEGESHVLDLKLVER